MLDIKLLRDDPGAIHRGLAPRGVEYPINDVLSLDAQRRKTQTERDAQRAELKAQSSKVAKASAEDRPAILERAKQLSERVRALEEEERMAEEKVRELMLRIPNLVHESVPAGGEDDAVEVVRVGQPRIFDFEPKDHVDLGEAIDGIDIARGARTSGARFAYLKGPVALLELALVRFVVDRLIERGFTFVIPPVLVRREAMEGTGFLPTDEAQIYRLADDDLYLVGTSEVPLAALHADEYVDVSKPLRYCGFSSCFRREAGTYGKDTRGIFRVHQFDKIEMFSFTSPSESWNEHEYLRETQEQILQSLEIPYRVMNIAAGDLGGSAAKKYDLEGWFPGQQAYRELTSVSNCTDYQARRLNIRTKTPDGPTTVHTLNGTASAVGRTIIALMENHQTEDGNVSLPEPLVSYFGRSSLVER
ncbi:MAG: serine--tRNA ligase [Actinomycetota bacterium]